MRHPNALRRFGFTLVELLVVIGIIALLIAILLPALSKAREQANLVKCLATLRNMGQAAQLHAAEHNGYMPLAGILTVPVYPESIRDPSRRKYTYYRDELNGGLDGYPTDSPAPLSAALGRCMNLSLDLTSRKTLQENLRQEAVIRAFTCAADNNPFVPASSLNWGSTWRTPDEAMSYLLNSSVLGIGLPDRSPAGKLSAIRRPAEVFLFMDGKRAAKPPTSYAVFCAGDQFESGSLFDYWNQYGNSGNFGTIPTFDYTRHRKRANVVFVDGHAETVQLPDFPTPRSHGDFDRIGVSKGIFP